MEEKPFEQPQPSVTVEEPQKSSFPKIGMIIVFLGIIALLALGSFVFISFSQRNISQTETKKIYHVGILSGLDLFTSVAESFKTEMKVLGYEEGNNIIYDYQKTNFEPKREEQILQKFVEDKVDLIFCYNTEVALAAKKATQGTDIPVVFANSFVEGTDLIESTKNPGGNITGVRYPGVDVALKRLEIMHEMVPNVKRIWLPYQKGYPYAAKQLELIQSEAKKLDITIIEFPAENLAGLETELEKRSKGKDIGFDAVLLIPESLSTTRSAFDTIAKYTRDRKIPIAGSSIVTDDYGTLFAVSVNPVEIGMLGAHLADKILKGTNAGAISIVSPDSVLKINLKVANELEISVGEVMLSQANEIIR